MARINDVYSIIVPAQSPNLTAHTYTQIYGGTSGCSISVNDTIVSIGPASSIYINIRNISGGTGCYLLGDYKDVYLGSTNVR